MTDNRKDLPPVTASNFLEKVRETLSTYLGNRGDSFDRGLTVRDLKEAGLVSVSLSSLGKASIAGVGPAIDSAYETDLSAPPTPEGFRAVAAISNLIIECDAQTYTQGHGHAKSRLYGAAWISGALPVFSDAVLLTEFGGTVASHATDPARTWHLWLTWVTLDGVESITPAGGTNGVAVTTGQFISPLVRVMTGDGKPFTVLPTSQVIDGVTFTAGIYSTNAFLQDAQVSNAKIANLAVDDAKIANLSASKLTAGSIDVGSFISSKTYTPGNQGWRINGDGTAEFSGVVVRGTVYATAGQIGGNTIDEDAIRSGQTGYNTGSGFFLGADGRFSLGNSNGNRLTFDGTNLNLRSSSSGNARLEILNDTIIVYDASGAVRVKIGNLA